MENSHCVTALCAVLKSQHRMDDVESPHADVGTIHPWVAINRVSIYENVVRREWKHTENYWEFVFFSTRLHGYGFLYFRICWGFVRSFSQNHDKKQPSEFSKEKNQAKTNVFFRKLRDTANWCSICFSLGLVCTTCDPSQMKCSQPRTAGRGVLSHTLQTTL